VSIFVVSAGIVLEVSAGAIVDVSSVSVVVPPFPHAAKALSANTNNSFFMVLIFYNEQSC
jgi:hypothetical protein